MDTLRWLSGETKDSTDKHFMEPKAEAEEAELLIFNY
jgi:hypothetical protein